MDAARRDRDLISVVIPAYNAERWIDETLCSVRSQTHTNLEIVVVDDGSRDGTLAVAQRHAAADPRIRVIAQANGGVAAARNRGISETSGPFIAPVDADDLWAPTKLARQLRLMNEGGDRIGLVYCWFAIIDGESRVTHLDNRASAEGDVLRQLCLSNIVGNGSSALMRRRAVEAAGGYDSGLRAAHAQGCEDYKLYFKIAERYEYALVREYLTGYRDLPDNMSSDLWQMLRSRDLCVREFRPRHPELAGLFRAGRSRVMRFMVARSLRTGRSREAGRMLVEMIRDAPHHAAAELSRLALKAARAKWKGITSPKSAAARAERFTIGEAPALSPALPGP